jgi:hypothetical protein
MMSGAREFIRTKFPATIKLLGIVEYIHSSGKLENGLPFLSGGQA